MMFKNIQVLRAIAAGAVICLSMLFIENKYGNGSIILPDAARYLGLGIDLFFVISGFAIVTSIGPATAWRSFILSRLTRIYPIYWFYTTLMLLLVVVTPALFVRMDAPSIWKSYLLLPQIHYPLLAHGWPLVHGLYFYLVMTAIIAFKLPLRVALSVWAVLLVVALFTLREITDPVVMVVTNPLTLEFILGAFVGLLIRGGNRSYGRTALVFGCVTLVAAAILTDKILFFAPAGRIRYVGIPCALLVYGAAACAEWRLSFLARLGDASYSVYLCHIFVLVALGNVFAALHTQGIAFELVFVVVSIIAVHVMGLLSYRLLERPCTQYLRKYC